MEKDLPIKNGIVIPGHEIELTASRSGGPGGQHVNKSSTRITLRWNIKNTSALNDYQKELLLQKLHSRLTLDGDLIVHNSESRSQLKNREMALAHLAEIVRAGLHVPKKRIATRVPKSAKESRLKSKLRHSNIKKLRQGKNYDE